MTLEAVTAAKGLQGKADFKDVGSVRFGCVAITAPLVDSDGDGFYDFWEEHGIDANFDGVIDVDLPAFGARADHKDLFVEMDWRPGQQPSRKDIQALKAAFAVAPPDAGGTVNPDGLEGITLWIDTGDLMENGMLVGDDLGGGGDVLPDPVICLDDSFYAAKHDYFDCRPPARLSLHGQRHLTGREHLRRRLTPAGIAEIGGNDLTVYGTQAGLMFHELGHTLNLRHGGFEDLNNKPNYVSMMNYNYGLSIPQLGGGSGLIDFSPPRCATCPGGRGAIPADLDETALDETTVLDAERHREHVPVPRSRGRRQVLADERSGQRRRRRSGHRLDRRRHDLQLAPCRSTSTRTANASSPDRMESRTPSTAGGRPPAERRHHPRRPQPPVRHGEGTDVG